MPIAHLTSRIPFLTSFLFVTFGCIQDHPHQASAAKGAVWSNVALTATDQFRQRMAWALSQVLVTSVSGLSRSDEVEPWMVYYDIFVRNAFGNFRDVLREVSYSGLMGEYLTFRANKAIAFAGTYPDENYAREAMQLFSIGLWKVKEDGTAVVDASGERGVTYTNDDVATFARVWTGFDRQPSRGNIHLPEGFGTKNILDPSMLKPSWRDRFPKAKLDAGYLGDGYALCTDLSQRYFLSKGARYKQVAGGFSAEGKDFDSQSELADNGGFLGRFVPSATNSSLYKRLCAADGTGNCTFPLEVVLNESLPCDRQECVADRLRSVKVVDARSGTIKWYESLRPTCVRLTFSANSKYTKWTNGPNKRKKEWHQCADTNAAIATASCCELGTTKAKVTYKDANGDSTVVTGAPCNFAGEWLTYASADARCKAVGYEVCENNYLHYSTKKFQFGCGQGYFTWINKPCQVQVQVQSNGWVSIVEPRPASFGPAGETTSWNEPIFAPDSPNVFRVYWDDDLFPTYAQGCEGKGGVGGGCIKANGGTCLCNITVIEAAAFTDTSRVPSKAELDAELFVGSLPPEAFDTVHTAGYSPCTADVCTEAGKAGVKVYNKGPSSDSLALGIDTIFEVPATLAGGKPRFLRNRASTVRVAASSTSTFSFRNPPHFMPLLGEKFNHRTHLGEDMHLDAAVAGSRSNL